MTKLKYKVGCLIEAAKQGDVNFIAHQTNCFCRMANGIAPQIAQAFPEAEDADYRTKSGDTNKLGGVTYGCNEKHGVTVANLYSQYRWGTDGRKTNYGALGRCLAQLSDDLMDVRDGVRLGLPLIGCGLGGGDWKKVSELIEKHLNIFEPTIYVLTEEELEKCQIRNQ